MRRRDLLTALGAAAVYPLAGAARAQGTRHYRIGILETIAADRNVANLSGLTRGLREHGYVEGQNLTLDYRSAQGQGERFPALAAELVDMRVDLIVTRGTPAARAAKAATSTIPIVMAAIGEALGVGVIESLARPGGNLTGLSAFVTELAGKRIELLKETFPSMRRIGFMQNMGNPVAAAQWDATQAVAKALGLAVDLFDVRTEPDIVRGFSELQSRRIDALSVGIDALTQANAPAIVRLAAERKVLTAYPAREFVELGGLLSYGPSYPDLYRRAAGMIDKILKGTTPGDLAVEQPAKLELVVNSRTADTLGISFPRIFWRGPTR